MMKESYAILECCALFWVVFCIGGCKPVEAEHDIFIFYYHGLQDCYSYMLEQEEEGIKEMEYTDTVCVNDMLYDDIKNFRKVMKPLMANEIELNTGIYLKVDSDAVFVDCNRNVAREIKSDAHKMNYYARYYTVDKRWLYMIKSKFGYFQYLDSCQLRHDECVKALGLPNVIRKRIFETMSPQEVYIYYCSSKILILRTDRKKGSL